ncbi:MAG: DUF4126 family protein [Actinomycetota bacterium]|nr:DUF4126 family protein [Actinomycetota bacterium]
MHTFLVITQGIGLAVACGIRPFLPAVLAGGLASSGTGLDFDGTDFAFLASIPFLLGLVVAMAVVLGYERRRPGAFQAGPLAAGLAGVAIGMGALEFAGSLADEGHPAWAGIVGGLMCGGIAQAAARGVFAGAAGRLDEDARAAVPLYEEGIAAIIAALAIGVPPVSLVVLAALAFLLVRNRRRAGRKYAGLRILR